MNNVPRYIATAAIVVLFAWCPSALSQSVSGGGDVEQLAKKLASLLKKRGYVEVPLTLNKTGMLDVKVEVDGVPMLLILDTGANNLNLDKASATRAKLAVKGTEEKTSALGGTVPADVTKISRLSVGEIRGAAESYVVDFSPTNAWRKERGDPPCDGVLGGGYLKHYSAVIDCARPKLYLLDPAHRATNLTKLMKKGGYIEIPLELNKNGLLDVKVEVDGVSMLLFLDTGYTTIISLERSSAQRAKLRVRENEGKSSELGGGLAVGQAKIGKLSVGGLSSATDTQVVDFSPTNATRKANGAPPCDGVLGRRFLNRYSAVIDYACPTLYLLEPAGK
jgi:predicted aspartyl protease